jgi:pSer/pThr/pTyr-binding forkhead associated (FHA) protein
MLCHLKVIDGPARGAQLLLGSNQRMCIGRISTADFSIASDQHLSRNHLIIEGVEESFRVTDVGSSNGTFVNNALIHSVLLCSGDIIRAGKSLFQVQLKREADVGSTESCLEPLPQATSEIPNRTMFAEQLMDRPTELHSPRQVPPIDPNGAGQRNSSFNDEATLCSPLDDSQGLLLMSSHFSIDDPNEILWKQRTPPLADLQLTILRSFSRLALNVHLVVNRRQVDTAAMTVIQFQMVPGELTDLTETLCLISTKRESIFQAVCKACVGRDAMILIAARQPLQSLWLEQSIDAFSYPSLLMSVVRESPTRAKSLTKNVEFLLFETTAQGPLCLLACSELRDKMRRFKLNGN